MAYIVDHENTLWKYKTHNKKSTFSGVAKSSKYDGKKMLMFLTSLRKDIIVVVQGWYKVLYVKYFISSLNTFAFLPETTLQTYCKGRNKIWKKIICGGLDSCSPPWPWKWSCFFGFSEMFNTLQLNSQQTKDLASKQIRK